LNGYTLVEHLKTAIIIGATGLTGQLLLERLASDDRYGTIKLFSRRPSGHASPKVKEFTGDVLELEDFREDFTGDVVFCCVGTTSSKTPDRKMYHAIDYGIPVKAARLSKENGIPSFLVISSIGANPRSRIFYSRTKGEMEEAVLAQEIPHTYILRPSLILGERSERRLTEQIGAVVMKALRFLLIGRARVYRAIEADTIAAAMVYLDRVRPDLPIIPSDRIQRFGDMD
jgi:uncharacterized protein YbjT (DUF2867 family)